MLATFLGSAALAAGPVLVGLDRVDVDGGKPFRDKRVGLVANAASVTLDGRHALDVLREHGVQVARVFAPEHGLGSELPPGVWGEDGAVTPGGIPVVSLYGARTKPGPEDLEGLDVLVVDLQDTGVRFYTYASTMLLCLEAAAENDLPLVVLDRPNPLSGVRVEGPLARAGEVPTSLVSMAPGPLVHGLTLGEMARYANEQRRDPAKLDVIAMKGWERTMVWQNTGRDWVSPSPNLRSPEAAIAYPGVALLEATNASEGRGTPTPFLLLGAPWLNVSQLLQRVSVPGFALGAVRFTPAPDPGALEPRYAGEECLGARVRVLDPRGARPYTLGVALLHALRWQQPRFAFEDRGMALARLLGTRRVYDALRRGHAVDEIVAADAADHSAWRQAMRRVTLY